MAFLTEAANRGSISTGPYQIENSSVWEPDLLDQAYLSQGSTAGTRTKQTFSVWIKRTELDSDQYIFEGGTGDANDTQFGIQFSASNKLQIMRGHTSGGYQYLLNTNRLFRDMYAWYHIVVAIDTTLSTADNRVRLYVNGIEETDFGNRNNPSQNDNLGTFAANSQISLGVSANLGKYIAAYIAHPALVYNAQLPPTDFGEFDSDSNIWIPKDLSAIDFGTYGYWLKNETSNQMYNDSSGNSRNFGRWDATIYQSTDTPTNNFPVLVPMYKPTASSTLSKGSLQWDINMPSGSAFQPNTSAMSSFQVSGTNGGKWYIESKITNNERGFVGIVSSLAYLRQTTDPTEFVYWDFYNGWIGSSLISTETNPPSASANDIIGIALDCDNQRVTFSKNGGWLVANGDMTGGSPSDWRWDWTSDANFLDHPNCNGNIAFWCGTQTDANTYRPIHQVNFGGYAPYTISSGNSDANGYGNFEYAVPSGFYALCTKNLAEYG